MAIYQGYDVFKEFFKNLFTSLIPPDSPLGTESGVIPETEILAYRHARHRWSRGLSLSVILLWFGCLGFALWATGYVPKTTGFAYADHENATSQAFERKIDELASQAKDATVIQLEERLMDVRRRDCEAISQRNELAKDTYATLMVELRRRYYSLTQQPWEIINCDAL
jgi:hypothetical protein